MFWLQLILHLRVLTSRTSNMLLIMIWFAFSSLFSLLILSSFPSSSLQPRDIENYIHRIGRTGRGNRTGVATTFINHNSSDTVLLDLKHLLQEAHQIVPPVLESIPDPSATFIEVDGTKGCSYCGGLGHRITDCPKLKQQTKSQLNRARGEEGAGGDW